MDFSSNFRCQFECDRRFTEPPRNSNSEIPIVSMKNIQNGFIIFEDVRQVDNNRILI